MAEVDLKHAVGKGWAQLQYRYTAESKTEKIGADTVKARTKGLEGEQSYTPSASLH
jgi:hypothetical protein